MLLHRANIGVLSIHAPAGSSDELRMLTLAHTHPLTHTHTYVRTHVRAYVLTLRARARTVGERYREFYSVIGSTRGCVTPFNKALVWLPICSWDDFAWARLQPGSRYCKGTVSISSTNMVSSISMPCLRVLLVHVVHTLTHTHTHHTHTHTTHARTNTTHRSL